jgi:hypothetical protein
MEALGAYPPTNSGAIDTKVVVCNYKSLTPALEDVDVSGLEVWLSELQETDTCHVSVRSHYAIAYSILYGGSSDDISPGAFIVECRIVKQMPLADAAAPFLDQIERGFEALRGIDGRLNWFERSEGSADYIRLLQSIPQSLRLVEQ